MTSITKKNSDNDCAKDGKSDLGVVRVVVVVSTYKYFFGKVQSC